MEDVTYDTKLMERRQLSDNTFEAVFSRPSGFEFTAGQRIRLIHGGLERDYSLANAPDESEMVLCIRRVAAGRFSTLLSSIPVGTAFTFSGPHGYFVFRASARPPVFVATGTGVAPFAAMAHSSVSAFTLLHGVRQARECYYASLFRSKARQYVVCLSDEVPPEAGSFQGRVTDYLASQLVPDRYDFYLCGRGEMIRDVTWLVDDRFPGSMVYTEIFY
ncbi:MAG: FAD-dependent oxidoreductase [Desulfobacterales bacterium]|jgi:ferredoxin-NADP reductase